MPDEDQPARRDDDYDDRPRPQSKGMSGTTIAIIIGLVFLCGGVPVVAILIGLLLPAVTKVREAASRVKDQNNLKQIGLGMFNDNDSHGRGFYSPYAHHEKTGEIYKQNSFRVSLLPFMEQDNLYRQFDLTQPWDSPRNKPFSDTIIGTYRTPNDTTNTTNTHYRTFVGGGSMFNEDGKPVTLADIKDGPGNTIMMVLAADAVPWAKPQELVYNPNGPLPAIGHPSNPTGFNVLFADGSVRFLKAPVPDVTLRALITRAGNENVTPDGL